MLTVEYSDETESAGIFFDTAGGELLIEVIQQMLSKQENDHIHFFPDEYFDWVDKSKIPEENWSLAKEKYSQIADNKVAKRFTLARRKDTT